jgi:hypothetical protein
MTAPVLHNFNPVGYNKRKVLKYFSYCAVSCAGLFALIDIWLGYWDNPTDSQFWRLIYKYITTGGTAFLVTFWIFEKYAWHWRLVRILRLVDLPDLRGEWEAESEPVALFELGRNRGLDKAQSNDYPSEVSIKQSLDELYFQKTNFAGKDRKKSSTDHSRASSLVYEDGGWNCYITYHNEPIPGKAKAGAPHFGTLRLSVDISSNGRASHMEGFYWTNKDTDVGGHKIRGTVGNIKLRHLDPS